MCPALYNIEYLIIMTTIYNGNFLQNRHLSHHAKLIIMIDCLID